MRTGLFGLVLSAVSIAAAVPARADIRLPAIFSNHLVLQQKQKDRVWGWADPGEKVTVEVRGNAGNVRGLSLAAATTTAGDDGKWLVTLNPIPAGGPYTMTVKGENTITLDDVLVGEVWICSGQSNMEWPVSSANDPDLESASANFPMIRLISVPHVGADSPQDDFKGRWKVCTPETVKGFSAVGYFFGRQLHQTLGLGVPVGLIDDAWGGSAAEAWVRRDLLRKDPAYKPLLERWETREAAFEKAMDEYKKALAAYEKAAAEGKAPASKPKEPNRNAMQLHPNHQPGAIYNGVLKPTIGYGIRGVVWYQGESNADRAYQYRDLFPLMIKSWRDEWGIGDFPFYWVQLADFMAEKTEPGDSAWAELREAQTMTMSKLPHTGEAVIIDLGEAKDIHPRNKQDVAKRLARWALSHDYGLNIPHHSPRYKSMEKKDGKIILTFDHVGQTLKPFDVKEPIGFAVAGSDRKFAWAKAKLVGKDKVEVWSDAVKDPVAVRYAWADNPRCNLYSSDGLPVTPFRTDDWPGVTAEAK
jgi:sialate O-acetylesterase